MNAEIIAVGSEMLTPERLDTNSLYLTAELNKLGVEVVSKCVIGDDRQRLAEQVRQSMGRSRGGLTSEIHALVDTNGLPVRLALTAGEAHDNRLAGKLLSRLRSGAMLLADRGYDADWIRALAAEKGAWANIPPRSNRNEPICFSPHLYRARNLVERFFNKIKHCRRVATRYDKLAANYLAFVQLASIRLWLRLNESAS